jgi:hypothetical protein
MRFKRARAPQPLKRSSQSLVGTRSIPVNANLR